jgi:hypothetical protein
MSKNILSTFILLFVATSFFYSCSKVDDDNEKPLVEILLPQKNTDIPLDSFYIFKAHFKDNEGLSSYFIQISNPNAKNNRVIRDTTKTIKDSLIYLDQIFQRANIFGTKDTVISHDFYLDTISTYKNSTHPTCLGKYEFKVVVVDMAGNRDSSSWEINVVAPIKKDVKK